MPKGMIFQKRRKKAYAKRHIFQKRQKKDYPERHSAQKIRKYYGLRADMVEFNTLCGTMG
jgi:hypothetical protein